METAGNSQRQRSFLKKKNNFKETKLRRSKKKSIARIRNTVGVVILLLYRFFYLTTTLLKKDYEKASCDDTINPILCGMILNLTRQNKLKTIVSTI